MSGRLLVTICGRAGSKGFANKNLKVFCGKPLVYYSLSAAGLFAAARPDVELDIVLNTDSDALRELVLARYPEVVALDRPPELAGGAVPKMAVFQHCLREMEARAGRPYDWQMDLDITSPLRTAEDVAGCFAMLEGRPDLDLAMSGVPSRRNPFMNMALRVGDHVEQVVKSQFVARQQAPQCYDLNASIYVFRRDFLAANTTGFLWDGKCDIFEMADPGVLDIDSEEDFVLMELIAGQFFDAKPAFARVRDNIRG